MRRDGGHQGNPPKLNQEVEEQKLNQKHLKKLAQDLKVDTIQPLTSAHVDSQTKQPNGYIAVSSFSTPLSPQVINIQNPSILMIKHLSPSISETIVPEKLRQNMELSFFKRSPISPSLETLPVQIDEKDNKHWEPELGKDGFAGVFEISSRLPEPSQQNHSDRINKTLDPTKRYAAIISCSLDGLMNDYKAKWHQETIQSNITNGDFINDITRDQINNIMLRNGQKNMYKLLECCCASCEDPSGNKKLGYSVEQDTKSINYGSLISGPPLMVSTNDIDIIQYSNASNPDPINQTVIHNVGASFATEKPDRAAIFISPLHGILGIQGKITSQTSAIPSFIGTGISHMSPEIENRLSQIYNINDNLSISNHVQIGKLNIPSNTRIQKIVSETCKQVEGCKQTHYVPLCCELGQVIN